MQAAYHLGGGASVIRRLKLGASVANIGVLLRDGTAGVGPVTTTDAADTPGLGLSTGTYSTTQGDAEGLVDCDIRPDLVIRALMSGGATEGTALTLLSNTAASAGGTTITDADVGSNTVATGTTWCIGGANVGLSRTVTTFNSGTSIVVTVPFPRAIAVGDEFLQCPYSFSATGAGMGNVQSTTLFTQADASIAAGTGLLVTVCDLGLNGRSDSFVDMIAGDHLFCGVSTI